MTNVSNFNDQGKTEEIFNAVSHGIGAALAIAGTSVMLVFAVRSGNAIDIVSASIYCFSLIFLYIISTLYHSCTRHTTAFVFSPFHSYPTILTSDSSGKF